jgi:hypothetical protein
MGDSDERREVTDDLDRERIDRGLSEIEELLAEIADADVDAYWDFPAVPTDDVSYRLADLAMRLRQMFWLEENDRDLTTLFELQPLLRHEVEQLHEDHRKLLRLLEHLCELAGSASRPASSWQDIESHFLSFEQALNCHHRQEADFKKRAVEGAGRLGEPTYDAVF